jgi:hypothetical protein
MSARYRTSPTSHVPLCPSPIPPCSSSVPLSTSSDPFYSTSSADTFSPSLSSLTLSHFTSIKSKVNSNISHQDLNSLSHLSFFFLHETTNFISSCPLDKTLFARSCRLKQQLSLCLCLFLYLYFALYNMPCRRSSKKLNVFFSLINSFLQIT